MRVHRNLHNARVGGPQWTETVRGKVARYMEHTALRDMTTTVSVPGVARSARMHRRKVVAWFNGTECEAPTVDATWCRVAFDPRDGRPSFLADGKPFTTADYAVMTADGTTLVLNPRNDR